MKNLSSKSLFFNKKIRICKKILFSILFLIFGLTVFAQPSVSITTSSSAICNGNSSLLTANATGDGTLSYHWYPGNQTTSSITVYPNSTTEYKVIVTDENDLEDSSFSTITVLQPSIGDTTVFACNSFTWYGQEYTTSGNPTHTFTNANASGCDSVVTLHLTIGNSNTGDTTVFACNTFTWYGQEYTTSGNPTHTFTGANASGCDSVVTLHLTIGNSNTGDTTVFACNTFTWYGQEYTTSGNPTHTFTNANASGCDSVVTLHLTIGNANTGDTTVFACNTFTWYGTEYTTSGNPTHTFTGANASGCDSVVTLHLTIGNSNTGDTTVFACNTFTWYGQEYTTSGNPTHTFTGANASGCDSVVTLHLTIGNSNTGDTTVFACNTFTWYGQEYTTSGNPTHTFTGANASGCDSVVTLHLTIGNSNTGDTTVFACNTFTWYGQEYTTSGNPTHTFTGANASGCDSVVTLHLTIGNSNTGDTTVFACNTFTWYGQEYTTSGNPTHTFTGANASGCDSVVTLHLTIGNSNTGDTTVFACNTFTWYGQEYTTSGNPTHTFTGANASGCDSVVTLHLTIGNSNTGDTTVFACNTFTWYGTEYTTSGNPTHTFTGANASGCDSVVTLHLTIGNSNTGDTTVFACNTFTWYGQEYTTSGNPTHTFTGANASGCDSVVTLHLTIGNTNTGDTTAFACNSFTWYGTEYTTSSNPTHTFTNTSGCDSVVTLYLTIGHTNTGDTTAFACNSFTWYGTEYTASAEPTHTFTNASGCDSVVTLHLTIGNANTGDTTAFACGSFTWYGTEYTASAEPTHTFTNASGCDSVVTLHLTIGNANTGDTTAFACGSFTWYGTEYTTSSNPTHTFTNASGCDSVVTLHLTIGNSNTGDTTAFACNSFTWYGTEYTASAEPTHTFTNASGCDSVVTLHLTIGNANTGDTTAFACGSFTWYGTEYTASAEPTHTFTNANASGCDSVVTLHLTIGNTNTGDTTAFACNSFTWYGTEYTASAEPTHTFTNASGCDSVVTLHLTIGNANTGDTTAFACGSFTWYGTEYTASAEPTYTFTNASGCDSVVTLHLTIGNANTGDTTAFACGSFTWYGTEYTTSSNPTHTFTNASGCDSVVTLHLTIGNSNTGDTTAFACGSFTWYGTEYTESAEPTHTFTNASGCDSVVTLHLTIGNANTGDTTAFACNSFTWYGTEYTASAEPTHTFTNASGCDSVVTLHLTIGNANTGDTTAFACGSFTWYGTEYTASAEPTYTFTNTSGCDSVVTLHLTIGNTNTGDTTAFACNSFTWYGTEYTASAEPTQTFTNASGCDSVVTLHLTIGNANTGDTTAFACGSFTWYETEYTASAEPTYTFTNASGCDSVVTLHLTIGNANTGDTTAFACGSFTWYGTEYTESAEPTYTFTNASGCDSVVTLHLTIGNANTGDTTAFACGSFTWYETEYTASAEPTHTFTNASGCDSVVTLHLTIGNANTGDTSVFACNTFTWYGNEYTESAEPTYTFTNASGCDSVVTLHLTITQNPSAGTLSGTQNICALGTTTLESTVEGGIWTSANEDSATISPTTGLVTSIGIGQIMMTYTVSGTGGCSDVSDSLLIIINPAIPASVSINSDDEDNIICAGTTITFTAAPVNGGDEPTYQWKKNDTNIDGETNSTFTTSVLEDGDVISVEMISSASPCLTGSPANSNSITITVNAVTSIEQITGNTTICRNTTNLQNSTSGGEWSSANTSIATVNNVGLVTKVSIGQTKIYYNYTNEFGCVSSDSAVVNILNTPAAPTTITGPREICGFVNQNTVATYNLTPVAGAESYIWYLSTGSNIESGQGTESVTASFDSTFAPSGYAAFYIASVSPEGCTSSYTPLWLFKTIPTLGSISGANNACEYISKDTVIYYSVDSVANVVTYKWDFPTGVEYISGQGTKTVGVKFNSSFTGNATYIKVTGISNCGSKAPKTLQIHKYVPAQPGVITGSTRVCDYLGSATHVVYKITPVTNATSYLWTLPSGVNVVSGLNSDSLVVTFASNYTTAAFSVKAVSNCYTSAARTLTVTAPPYPVPGVISGPSNPCSFINTSNTATYIINKSIGATGYLWTAPLGMTITDHPGGVEENDTIITVSFNTSFRATDTLKVQSTGCNNSAFRTFVIKKAVPGAPTKLVGLTNVCSAYNNSTSMSDSVGYKTNTVLNANTYTWTIPTNSNSLTSLTTSDTILGLKYLSSFTSGTITVKANNYCGTSTTAKALSITKVVAATPTAIQKSFVPSVAAITNVSGLTKDTLKIRKVANATGYNWTMKIGTYVSSITHMNNPGENDTAVVINIIAGFTKDTVSVTSLTTCSISAEKKLALSALSLPPTPIAIAGSASPCKGSTVSYTASAGSTSSTQAPTSSFRWTKPNGTTIVSSNSDSSQIGLRFDNTYTGGTLSVKAVSAVNVASTSSFSLTLKYLPPTPTAINASTSNFSPCVGNTVTYTVSCPAPTTAQATAAKFRWTIPTNSTITSSPNADSSSISVIFNNSYTGGTITAKAVSACDVVGTVKSVSMVSLKLPATPTSITSLTANACVGDNIVFNTTSPSPSSSQEATSKYRWTIPAYTNITNANTDSSQITLHFNAGYIGGILSVKGQTACGALGTAKTKSLTHTGCAFGTFARIDLNNEKLDKTPTPMIFPNPNNGSFKFVVNTGVITNESAIVHIFDLYGKIVANYRTTNQNGRIELSVINDKLINGVYTVKYQLASQNGMARMIIQKIKSKK